MNNLYEYIKETGKYRRAINGRVYYYIKAICKVCGKELYRPSNYFKTHKNPVCSRECFSKLFLIDEIVNEDGYSLYKDNIFRKRSNDKSYVYYYRTQCKFCNKVLYRRLADRKEGRFNFCDRACRSSYRKKFDLNKKYHKGMEEIIDDNTKRKYTGKSWSYLVKHNCKACGKEVYREEKQNILNHFCSDECEYNYNDPKGSKILEKQNDENFYYLLGLIATDGTVSTDTNTVIISLSHCDYKLLYNIKEYFGGKIHTYSNSSTMAWDICNSKFHKYLMDIGITNKKSLTLNVEEWFNKLPYNFQQHFVRGSIDGDGSLSVFNNQLTFSLYSCSSKFCSLIRDWFDVSYSIYTSKLKSGTNQHVFCDTGFNSINFINKLYNNFDKNKHLGLKRKYQTYEIFKNVSTVEEYNALRTDFKNILSKEIESYNIIRDNEFFIDKKTWNKLNEGYTSDIIIDHLYKLIKENNMLLFNEMTFKKTKQILKGLWCEQHFNENLNMENIKNCMIYRLKHD